MVDGCHRVSCGRPDTKQFAAFNAKELLYQDSVKYTCNEGYTTTGKVDGGSDFSLECFGDKMIKDWDFRSKATLL